MAEFLTVQDIARATGKKFHVVKYAIAAHGIPEAKRVGVIRLFSHDQLPTIAAALASTSGRRSAEKPAHPKSCSS
jgi:hypothetical protein